MIIIQLSDFEDGKYNLARSPDDDKVIQKYIDAWEKPTLRKLLGKDLADLFIAYIIVRLTSGDLVNATQYIIAEYQEGDDFTNIGAASNETGEIFTATGTTPTDWSNESVLRPYVARYENLYQEFYFDPTDENWFAELCDNEARESFGIKDLLTITIYYYYLAETQIRQGQSGVYSQSGENSKILSPDLSVRLGEKQWNTRLLDTWTAIRWYCLVKYKDIYPDFKGRPETTRSSFA